MHASFSGTATLNGVSGYTIIVDLEDLGEPARRDKFRIRILGTGGLLYDSDLVSEQLGLLDKGGNVQVSRPD